MRTEIAAWNGGDGTDLETWVGCSGSFSLAVGYTTLFWPEFVEYKDHVLMEGFSEQSFQSFASRTGATRESVEWVMNHTHLHDIHYVGCKDISKDKLRFLGFVLKDIYQTKLASRFPSRRFVVDFHVPPDEDDLGEYRISFWQAESIQS